MPHTVLENYLPVGAHFEWTGSTSTMVKYYYAGGQRIAMRKGSSAPIFLLGDHLGSTAKTYTKNNNVVTITELRYTPWGATRYTYGSTPTSYQYTGQRKDATGLYFYNARYYDPALGRFLAADSIVPDPANPQSLNRYSYVVNNPLKYTDPTGHAYDPWGGMNSGGGAISAAAAIKVFEALSADGDPTNEIAAGAQAVSDIAQAVSADGDPTNEVVAGVQAVNNIAQTVLADGDPTNEVNQVSNFVQSELSAVEKFAEEADKINTARGYGSFGQMWSHLARIADPTRLFVNRVGGRVTGMMKVNISQRGYEIRMLEGIGSGAGTNLFKSAIQDSIVQGYGGSIHLFPAEMALEWYLTNFPGAQQMTDGSLYWSAEAAQAILTGQ